MCQYVAGVYACVNVRVCCAHKLLLLCSCRVSKNEIFKLLIIIFRPACVNIFYIYLYMQVAHIVHVHVAVTYLLTFRSYNWSVVVLHYKLYYWSQRRVCVCVRSCLKLRNIWWISITSATYTGSSHTLNNATDAWRWNTPLIDIAIATVRTYF